MRRLTLPKFEFAYANSFDSEERLKRAYDRIIDMAIDNILREKRAATGKKVNHLVDINSTQKYTKVRYE